MKRKSIVVLLVLLLVGILAFTAFACNNNKDKGDDDDKKPPVEEKPEDETPGYLAEALTSVVSGADGLIKELASIEDEAYISAGLEFGVIVGEGEEQFELDVALNLKASISENTTSKNWAFVEIAVGGEEGNNVALFAEAAGENKEIVYLGQSLTDAEYKWSKLSQLDVSELADSPIVGSLLTGEGGLISNVYTAITNLNAMEIDDDTFGKGTFGDLASQGFIGNSSLSSLISMAGTIASGLIPTTKSTVNGDTVYEATLDITEVSSLISGLGGEIDLSGFKDIIDAIGPILLGLTYDQITNPDAQVSEDPADYPTITIVITIGEDGALKGLSLHYDYDIALTDGADPTFVALDLKISDLVVSSTAKAVERPEGVENAEEFAAHIALNAVVPSLNGEQASATVDLYVNPAVKLGWDADGYVAIDFSDLEGYATLSYQRGSGALVQNVMIAQYNSELGGFVIDLEPVFQLAGTTSVNGTYDYFIALDAQTMYDSWIAGQKEAAAATPAAAPMNAASDVDTIIDTIAGMVTAGQFDFGGVMGLISPVVNAFNSIGAIFEDTSLVVLPDLDDNATSATVTVKLVNLMSELLASDGLIGGLESEYVEFDLYTGTANEKATYTLAEILDGDDVLGHIVTLVNSLMYEGKLNPEIAKWKAGNVQNEGETAEQYDQRAYNAAVEVVGTYADFIATDEDVSVDNVYAWAAKLGIALSADKSNLYEAIGDIEATVSYRDGISAELSLAGITIGISANIEEYVAPATDKAMAKPAEVSGTVETTVYSNYTANDNGRLLYNTLKELANAALLNVTDGTDKFEQTIVTVTLNAVV